jgi:hypothetical protein
MSKFEETAKTINNALKGLGELQRYFFKYTLKNNTLRNKKALMKKQSLRS